MAAYRLKSSHFSNVFELKADEHGAALCEGRIDGFVFVAGHPSANLQDVTTTCAARLVPLQGPVIDRLVEEKPYYAKVEIPANTYPGNPDPTPTFGALATLVSSSDVPDDTVYAVVKSIFEHFDEFRKLHPALAHLEPEQMVHQGLTMPLHAGACATTGNAAGCSKRPACPMRRLVRLDPRAVHDALVGLDNHRIALGQPFQHLHVGG